MCMLKNLYASTKLSASIALNQLMLMDTEANQGVVKGFGSTNYRLPMQVLHRRPTNVIVRGSNEATPMVRVPHSFSLLYRMNHFSLSLVSGEGSP